MSLSLSNFYLFTKESFTVSESDMRTQAVCLKIPHWSFRTWIVKSTGQETNQTTRHFVLRQKKQTYNLNPVNFYRPQTKVMFLHVYFILSTGGGGMHGGGHGRGACVAGGSVRGRGACVAGGHAWQGGMHGRGACVAGGHAWQGMCVRGAWQEACVTGLCVAGGRGHAWQERWPLLRIVHILLECILVL